MYDDYDDNDDYGFLNPDNQGVFTEPTDMTRYYVPQRLQDQLLHNSAESLNGEIEKAKSYNDEAIREYLMRLQRKADEDSI
ncbi:MAG: hypothetical protein LBN25_03215 [Christensenellaceae bacterium]|jgi:hypothetical protein|nr:hypothetical protein [Christensenellaceae bacterium]